MTKSKKEVIQIAAARLFRDRGYAATSMRDLAEAVQLKASSLYNHIKGKEEILQAICFETANRFLMAMESIEQEDISNTEKAKKLIRLHVKTAMEDATSITAFNDEWRHLSEPHLSEFMAIRKTYENKFKAIIKQGIDNNEFKPIQPVIILYTFLSSVRWLYDWYNPNGDITSNDVEENIVDILMDGIMK